MLSFMQFKKAVREVVQQLDLNLDIPVTVVPESKSQSQELGDVYVMGEYLEMRLPDENYVFEPQYKAASRQIKIYYGSFVKNFVFLSDEELLEKIKEVVAHELTHYRYSLHGEKDLLAVQDDVELYQIKREKGLLSFADQHPWFPIIVVLLIAFVVFPLFLNLVCGSVPRQPH